MRCLWLYDAPIFPDHLQVHVEDGKEGANKVRTEHLGLLALLSSGIGHLVIPPSKAPYISGTGGWDATAAGTNSLTQPTSMAIRNRSEVNASLAISRGGNKLNQAQPASQLSTRGLHHVLAALEESDIKTCPLCPSSHIAREEWTFGRRHDSPPEHARAAQGPRRRLRQ